MSVSAQTWSPLVTGRRAEAVWAVVDEILGELSAAPLHGPGLAGGHAGLALVYGYVGLCRESCRPTAWHLARNHLDAAEKAAVVSDPSLFTGACGVGWVSDLLNRRLAGAAVEQDALNRQLTTVATTPLRGGYDLTHGLSGLLIYARTQADTPTGRHLHARVLDRMCSMHQRLGDRFWLTRASSSEESLRGEYPAGFYNLGLAHGVPGALCVLARAPARDGFPGTDRLVSGGLDLLLRNQRRDGGPEFPYWVASDGHKLRIGRRLAWCYGDLSVALALVTVGRCLGDARLLGLGIELARRTLERRDDAADVADATLCHGAIANAHAYNRLYQATGDSSFREGALGWLAYALDLRTPGQGLAGFGCAARPTDRAPHRAVPVPGVLTGVGGIVLGLLAFISDVEPGWDGALVLNVPPTREGHR